VALPRERIMLAGIQYTCSETPAALISDFLPIHADGTKNSLRSNAIFTLSIIHNIAVLTLTVIWVVVHEKLLSG